MIVLFYQNLATSNVGDKQTATVWYKEAKIHVDFQTPPMQPNNGIENLVEGVTNVDLKAHLVHRNQRIQQRKLEQVSSSENIKYQARKKPTHILGNENFINSEKHGVQRENPEYFQQESDPANRSSFLPLILHPTAQGTIRPLKPNGYLYSAYYDNRHPENDYIRMIVLIDAKLGILQPMLFCKFGDIQDIEPDEWQTYMSKVQYYEMCENHGKQYGGYILSCEVPATLSRTEIKHVTIASLNADNYFESLVTIPVLNQHSEKSKYNFSICVSPIYGEINPYRLVQFLEMNKILGAEHFTFYIHEQSNIIRKVLQLYNSEGHVTLLPWQLPVEPELDVWYYGQLLSINDCLYRNMYKSTYLVFQDLDEILVPRHSRNWSEMLTRLNEESLRLPHHRTPAVGFIFDSAYFHPVLPYTYATDVIYYQYTKRTAMYSKVRTKVLVDGKKVFELGIHHVSKTINDKYRVEKANVTEGLIHHYRQCYTIYDSKMSCDKFRKDEYLVQYKTQLLERYRKVLKTFDLKNKGASD